MKIPPYELIYSDAHRLFQIDFNRRYMNGFHIGDGYLFHCRRLGSNWVDSFELSITDDSDGPNVADGNAAHDSQHITITRYDLDSGECVWSLDEQDFDSYVTSCDIFYGGGNPSLN